MRRAARLSRKDYTAVGFDAGDMERYINAYGSNVYDKPTSVT